MSKKLRPWLFTLAGLIVLSVGFYMLQMRDNGGIVQAQDGSQASQMAPAAGEEEQAETPVETPAETQAEPQTEAQATAAVPSADLEKMLKPRIMGDQTAPIRIEEFASLSCTHCADFHEKTLPEIKKNYIDTGKAYIVFNDFPLNASALYGSMAARCVPEARYFDFIKLLFEKQKDWAFQENFAQILGQYTSLLGLGKDEYEACLNNEALQKGLIANVTAAQEKWKISSTPSFVINDNDVVSGAQAYKTFEEKFEAILKAKNTPE